MLTFNNISCSRGGRVLYEKLGFTVGDCCLLVVRGDNGAGKTTLLEVIAGLIDPLEGEILYANEKVKGSHYQEYCDIVQYVGHKPALKGALTVYENLQFWAQVRGNMELLLPALNYFALEEVADVPCRMLSAGWQRKVALSRLILARSEIWLLDEPFTSLDEGACYRLAELIKSRVEQGGAVIMAAHGEVPLKDYCELNLTDFKGV